MQNTINTIARTLRFDRSRAEDPAAVREHLSFAGREAYLAWVAEWKRLWHELVREIQETKTVLRRPHVRPEASAAQFRLWQLRHRAHAMLILRRETKALSKEHRMRRE